MKTLTQHIYENLFTKHEINEKLIINKDFKSYHEYSCEKPNDSGTCLGISIPTIYNTNDERIALYEFNYYKDGDMISVGNINFELGDDGFYFKTQDTNKPDWICILLFGKDAKKFLNKLLKNNRRKIDISEFVDSIDIAKKEKFVCKDNWKSLYDEDRINDIKYNIK
jgi:hypothetical protein